MTSKHMMLDTSCALHRSGGPVKIQSQTLPADNGAASYYAAFGYLALVALRVF